MSRVLLTGASGFVGAPTLDALVRAGHEVHALAREPGRPLDGVSWHVADLLDPDAGSLLRELLDDLAPELLVHLAWYAEHGKFWAATENVRWVEASLALLRAFTAAGGRRAVMVGTCAEYDWSRSEPFDEQAPLRPATLYGAAKHGLHTVAAALCHQVGVEFAWGRLFFLYGPFEAPGRFVSSIVLPLLRDEPATMTAGTQRRDFLHTVDAGGALAALAASDVVGPVNIASGEVLELRDLAQRIAARIDTGQLRLGARPMPEGEPPALLADARRLHEEVGWRPSLDIDEGLDQAIDWWRMRLAAESE
ncbi:MAG TPA: NAD(P)-dependent oxidoreductase [Solirubrobacteraceae bacterium]|jgi:nucleoside-diphosphate-sugar epimerase|nr:NAD(P)-dependent oxidoreductase [Solirubrobacteraceae bacterium]